MDIALRLPVIGLGASAHLYYPKVAKKLGTTAVIPDFAGVANAVGAVVGQVRLVVHASISPAENDYNILAILVVFYLIMSFLI